MQWKQVLTWYRYQSIGPTMIVGEFDFEYPGSQTLNNGSHLPRSEAMLRQTFRQRYGREQFDRRTHQVSRLSDITGDELRKLFASKNDPHASYQGSPILKVGEEVDHVVTAVNAVSCGPSVCC